MELKANFDSFRHALDSARRRAGEYQGGEGGVNEKPIFTCEKCRENYYSLSAYGLCSICQDADDDNILGAVARWRIVFKQVQVARAAADDARDKVRVAEANQRNSEQRAEEARAALLKVIFPESK